MRLRLLSRRRKAELETVMKKTEKTWHTMRLTALATLKEGYAFFNPSKQWHRARPGDSVFGYVIYDGAITLGRADREGFISMLCIKHFTEAFFELDYLWLL